MWLTLACSSSATLILHFGEKRLSLGDVADSVVALLGYFAVFQSKFSPEAESTIGLAPAFCH